MPLLLPGLSRIHFVVFSLTFLCILLGSLLPGLLAASEVYLVLGLMLLLGLPHGATDRGLYEALRTGGRPRKPWRFHALYLGVIAAYGLVWYLLPALAFVAFLVLSVYHFGQSNWAHTRYGSSTLRRAHYLLWGAGVLFTPILLHLDQAGAIVGEMIGGTAWLPDSATALQLIGGLALLNGLVILALRLTGRLDAGAFGRELLAYGLLLGLYFTNSLLLGFTVYFVLWHSLGSARDQWRFFTSRDRPFTLRRLLPDLLAVIGSAALFCGLAWGGWLQDAALSPYWMSWIFMIISLLTLPHMLLVEALYQRWTAPARPVAVAPAARPTPRIQPDPLPRRRPVSFSH